MLLMDADIVAQVHLLITEAPSLYATRYFASKLIILPSLSRFLLIALPTVAATVLTLWDHVLTLIAEIELIWRGKFDFFKVIFVLNRYFVEGTLIYVVYSTCFQTSRPTN